MIKKHLFRQLDDTAINDSIGCYSVVRHASAQFPFPRYHRRHLQFPGAIIHPNILDVTKGETAVDRNYLWLYPRRE